MILTVTDNEGLTDQVEQIISVGDWAIVEFEGLEPFYDVGEIVTVDLVENVPAKSRFDRIDPYGLVIQNPDIKN